MRFAKLFVHVVVATVVAVQWAGGAEISDGPWRYSLRKPPAAWRSADFDDARWAEGFGGFGERSTPGSRVSTDWTTNDIWLRRVVELGDVPARAALLIHHDEDAEVFINGEQVAALPGFVIDYQVVPLEPAARAKLRRGKNLLAVHCRQTTGGQFIDVHIVDADNVPKLPPPKRQQQPFLSELITTWGEKVTPENAWGEYPRPQLLRTNWQNLNGQWDYAVTDIDADRPQKWDGKILVPFCLESKLSGVQRLLHPDQALWYRRTIDLQPTPGRRTILNFEAVDYRCEVWLNKAKVGEHVGGNDPFSVDVTAAATEGENELLVHVTDATSGAQLRGKQTLDPRGIWYTRVSGIWQTVWLEEVPSRSIDRLKYTTHAADGTVRVEAAVAGRRSTGDKLRVAIREGDRVVAQADGEPAGLTLKIPDCRLWSPDDPHLYDVTAS
ncbi:MAG: glycoside hydrolase family 2, partial [Planctomycetales bacterium]|nr:glycoside hydrolase family 2 [Planctomycetales bacterium]